VAFGRTPFDAVTVRGYEPLVLAAGVPVSAPLPLPPRT